MNSTNDSLYIMDNAESDTPTSHALYSHVFTLCLTTIFVFGLLLNTISIITTLKAKKMQPINATANLAIADILYILG